MRYLKLIGVIFILSLCFKMEVCGLSASDGILSKDGYRFIKGYEGFASYPCYFNGESFKTYGYGITELYQPVYYAKLGSPPCTEKLASEVYGEMVINNFGKPLAEQMKRDGVDLAKVPINKFDAFVSLSMNAGLGGCTSSPMYKKFIVNINDESIATDWLTYATNGGLAGLVARRKAESDIFKSGTYEHRPIIKYDHNGNISGVVEGDGFIPPIFGDGGGGTEPEEPKDNAWFYMYGVRPITWKFRR